MGVHRRAAKRSLPLVSLALWRPCRIRIRRLPGGLYRLQQEGIEVSHGLMMSEAEALNKGF
jgi:hypothetical protein